MSVNFATLQGLSIPEGVVTQITDASGRVIWAVQSGGPIILEVEKITSNTYAAETTYKDEQFILLNIYPKTNGTVSVTYGGLTKTITDTSGVAEPNAQQVYFGTFNGVSDSVSTPSSGELTIEGDFVGFATQMYYTGKNTSAYYSGILAVASFGSANAISDGAFWGSSKLTSIIISRKIKAIGSLNPFIDTKENNFVSVETGNNAYKIDNSCLMEISTGRLVSGFADSIIPSYTKIIGERAFSFITTMASLSIPEGVERIGNQAFTRCDSLASITIPSTVTSMGGLPFYSCSALTSVTMLPTTPPKLSGANTFDSAVTTIIVPKGCGEAYKSAEHWSSYASKIVEAS